LEVEELIKDYEAQLQEAPSVSLTGLSSVTPAHLAGVMRKATSGEGGSFNASVKRVIIGKVCAHARTTGTSLYYAAACCLHGPGLTRRTWSCCSC